MQHCTNLSPALHAARSLFFGSNAVPLHMGVVRVGDTLEVLSKRSGPPLPYVH